MADLETKIRIQILDAFSGPLKALGASLDGLKAQLGDGALAQPFEQLNDELVENGKRMAEWAAHAGEPLARVGNGIADVQRQLARDGLAAPFEQSAKAVEGLRQRLQSLRGTFAFAADLNQAAEGMGRFANGITTMLRKPLDEFTSFEQAMSKVAALTNEVGTENFQRMKALAQELGSTTSYSSQQAAEAMAAFGQQGLTVEEILRVTPQTLALARGGMVDLGVAAQILGTSMAGMGLKADDAQRVVDVLAMAANAANTDVTGLGNAFSYVGPIAKDAGLSIEMTAAMLGKLADAGMDSNRAGTGLRAVMARLLSPSKEATKALREFGFSTAQIAQMQKDASTGKLDQTLRAMGEMGAKLPDEKRLKLLADIFGQEAESAASALISAKMDVTSGKGLDDLAAKLQNAEGAAQRAARVMEDNLAGELERTAGAISDLSIKLGEKLKPSIMDVAGGVQNIVGELSDFVEQNPDAANAIVRLTALAGGAALAAKGVLTMGGAAVSLFGALKGAKDVLVGAYELTKGVVTDFGPALKSAGQSFAAWSANMNGATAMTALKWAGAAAAAGALGYALGTWANEAFGISDRLAKAALWLTGQLRDFETRKERSIKQGGDQEYGDGTIIGANGEVKHLGDGPGKAPKIVREAMDAGARSRSEINEYIRKKRGAPVAPGQGPLQTGQTPYADGAGPAAGGVSPLLEDATRDQTRAVTGALRDVVAAQKEQTEELKRVTRGKPAQRDIGWAEHF